MKYDFTSVANRNNCGSLKWSPTETNPEFVGAYPLSVADMEWKTAPAIAEACTEFAQKGFFCYTDSDSAYKKAVCNFMLRRHEWAIKPEDIICTYGIVSALHTAVKSFTKPGDGVIIQTPVYHHFEDAITANGRIAVFNSLVINNGKYEMDYVDLEKKCADKNNKMIILCSPHNPVGRVWTKNELIRLAEICIKHNVLIVSDEIHFDITREKHTVLSSIDNGYKNYTVTCTAASKSFNIAGLGTAQIIIQNEQLREKFRNILHIDGYECINCFSYPALTAAYTKCDDWLDEMNKAVQQNFVFLRNCIKKDMPQIKLFDLEGTYLVWLDVKCFNIPDSEVVSYFAKNAGIIPNNGGWFGSEGDGYIRFNIAVPLSELQKATERLKNLYDRRVKETI